MVTKLRFRGRGTEGREGRLGYGTRTAECRRLGQARLAVSRVVQKISRFTRAGDGLFALFGICRRSTGTAWDGMRRQVVIS